MQTGDPLKTFSGLAIIGAACPAAAEAGDPSPCKVPDNVIETDALRCPMCDRPIDFTSGGQSIENCRRTV